MILVLLLVECFCCVILFWLFPRVFGSLLLDFYLSACFCLDVTLSSFTYYDSCLFVCLPVAFACEWVCVGCICFDDLRGFGLFAVFSFFVLLGLQSIVLAVFVVLTAVVCCLDLPWFVVWLW